MSPLLALAAVAVSRATAHIDRPCYRDVASMLSMPPAQFDQTPGEGWRAADDRPGCLIPAANLISLYRRENEQRLNQSDKLLSYWHEGQMRAMAGQRQRAIPLLLLGIPKPEDDQFDFHDYAVGTIAFLRRDLPTLKAARARLSIMPEPPEIRAMRVSQSGSVSNVPRWPFNLDVLDGLVTCFNKSYAVAYAARCRYGS